MSLRDYFAAKAAQGFIYHYWQIGDAEIAKRAFELADAMIAQRSRT